MTFKDYFLFENLDSKLPHLLRQFADMDVFQDIPEVAEREGFIKFIADDFDPTSSKDYITWILRLIRDNQIRASEDGPKVKERLEQFHRLKRTGRFTGERDINRYKTYADLVRTLDANEGVVSKGEQIRTSEIAGAVLEAKADNMELYKVTTPEAAAKLFRGTEWCVKDPAYSTQYLKEGPLYYFSKDNTPYGLLHFETGQFFNVYDAPFDSYAEFRPFGKWFIPHFKEIKDLHDWVDIIVGVGIAKELVHKIEQVVLDERYANLATVGTLAMFCYRTKISSTVLEHALCRKENHHVGMIARYSIKCKSGNWPEGEKKILELADAKLKSLTDKRFWDATRTVNYLQIYTAVVRRKPWPEAELLLKKYPTLESATKTYWSFTQSVFDDIASGDATWAKIESEANSKLPMTF